MLNWEYNAETERRVLTEEAELRGEQRERERWQSVVDELTAKKDDDLAAKDAEIAELKEKLSKMQ